VAFPPTGQWQGGATQATAINPGPALRPLKWPPKGISWATQWELCVTSWSWSGTSPGQSKSPVSAQLRAVEGPTPLTNAPAKPSGNQLSIANGDYKGATYDLNLLLLNSSDGG
jgi:hypothetical protein